jgi:phosphodiesterase/alkaline phosphatase D-like protein
MLGMSLMGTRVAVALRHASKSSVFAHATELGKALLAVALLVSLMPAAALQPRLADAACDMAVNPIACENALPGDPKGTWDIPTEDAGDPSIQGFATEISVNRGDTVRFKITSPSAYTIDIYRMGFYGGAGARKQASVTPSAAVVQPACLTQPTVGLVDCGNWSESATWTVPSTSVSGIYFAKLTSTATGGTSHIHFIVRDDTSTAPVLFQTSDETWQAYNSYGGASLYRDFQFGLSVGRAFKVSYNRPFNTRSTIDFLGNRSFVWSAEYAMVRFLEANGYNISYLAGADTERKGVAYLKQHKVFLSVGHDEYWSGGQRTVVEQARDQGVNLAFFSGNQMFWKTRWEDSTDGANTPYRTLVTYKETHLNAKVDPLPNVWTGTFRDPRFSPPADGGKPENAVSGSLFTVNGPQYNAMTVPAAMGKLRLWRNTPNVATLAPGAIYTVTAGCNCILGHEWDEDLDNGSRPAGLVRMSSTTANVPFYIQDYGSVYAPGTATHNLTFYRAPSGARVFGAGTVNWSWALDAAHDSDDQPASVPDANIRQATVNLLADMGAQPGTLQSGLVAATASLDAAAPMSTITAPANGANLPNGTPVNIVGTATENGGGQVGAIEVSLDGGATWHPAQGTTAWTYKFTPGVPGGTVNIKTRAVDDSGNIETPGAGITVNVTQRSCSTGPCSLWDDSVTPKVASNNDGNSTEVGVKFTSDQDGFIKGLRFYKGPNNTGTHIGSLWTNVQSPTPTKLGSVTFTNETATGWQQATFATPINIVAGQTYVASYHAPNGGYAVDQHYFATSELANSPLHALLDGVDGPNGLFDYTQNPHYPHMTFNSSNYWVDVVFSTNASNPATPTVTSTSPSANSTNAALSAVVKATFNESVVDTSVNFVLRENGTNAIVSTTFAYDPLTLTATLTPQGPLQLGTTYTASVLSVVDTTGVSMGAPVVWTFSTPTCPCSLWSNTDEPGDPEQEDGTARELGVHFKSQLDGVVTGVRFYKGSAANSGTHTGRLWSSTGTSLATVTFNTETASGWQQANFSSPVAITANTDYIVSYSAPAGHYAGDIGAFATLDREVGPLLAPHNSSPPAGVPNGVFGSIGNFPATNFQATNYWVDLVFDKGAPAAPAITVQPTATDLAPGTATIKWTTDKASDSLVEYGTSTSYGLLSVLNPAQVTQHSVALTALQPGTTYNYRVISRNSAGASVMSGNFTFSTAPLADSTPPQFLAGTIKATGVSSQSEKITWSTDENSTTQVEYGADGTYGSSTPITDATSPTTTHTVTLEDLQPSTTYHFRVKSADANSNLATSGDFTFTTLDLKISQVSAQVPIGEPGETSATVSWTTDAPSDSQVEYGTTTAYGSTTPLSDDLAETHVIVLSDLAPNTTYNFRVKSSATEGKTTVSGNFTFKTNAPKITNVVETSVDGRTERLTWTTAAPSDTQVEYGTSPTLGTFSPLNTALVTAHSVTLTGLQPGTTYYYRLMSRDSAGVLSTLSDTFTTPADGTPPAFVTGSIKANSITTNSATIVWATTEASDSQVEYGTTTAYGSSTTLKDVSLKVTSHSVGLTDLSGNTTYHFRVKSRDGAGNLATSGDFTFTTLSTPRSLSLNSPGAYSGAYAEAPHASEVNVLNDWTIEAWFKDESSNGYFHLPQTIISKGDEVSDKDVPFSIGITFGALYVTEKSNGQLAYMYYNLAAHRVPANSWHHVAVTMKGSTRQATMYLDGVQVMQGTLSRITTVGNSKPVSIGRNGGPTGFGVWRGNLDDVRIWNVVRTGAQISANYRSQLNGAQTGLVANWKFDEGSGNVAADSATIPENATLTNGAAFSTDVH